MSPYVELPISSRRKFPTGCRYPSLNGCRYHLAAVGNATWNLVIIQGTPASGGIWRQQFVQPFPGANLVAYDRPGFGNSHPSARTPHRAKQVAALTNLLAVLPRFPRS